MKHEHVPIEKERIDGYWADVHKSNPQAREIHEALKGTLYQRSVPGPDGSRVTVTVG